MSKNLIFKCKGRDDLGHEVLEEAVDVKISLEIGTDNVHVFSNVNCKYMQAHEKICNFSEDTPCPYSVVLPFEYNKTD